MERPVGRGPHYNERGEKWCGKCQRWLTVPENFSFHRRAADGLLAICRECGNKRRHVYYELNKEACNEKSRVYYNKNKDRMREKMASYGLKYKDEINLRKKYRRLKTKLIVFDAYGRKCACCGETEVNFLSIDHKNNDGNVHRRRDQISGSDSMHRWVIKNNFPDSLQLLCFNCNLAKGFYGICPHERRRQEALEAAD